MARPATHLVSAGGANSKATRYFPGNPPDVLYDNNVVRNASEFHEVCIGNTSPLLNGWRDPTGYSMVSKSVRRPSATYFNDSPGIIPGDHTEVVATGALTSGWLINDENCYDEVLLEADSHGPSYVPNSALVAAMGRLKGTRVNLGVAFGERKQTARLLGDTAVRIAQSFSQLRKGRFNKAATILGLKTAPRKPRGSNITKEWLALQYGWKPLLSDVYGAAKELHSSDASNFRVTANGNAKYKYQNKVIHTDESYSVPYIASVVQSVSARCRIDAVPTNGFTQSLSRLGITNPLSVGWELVPFSFVVDWMLPIGNWLDTFDSYLGYGNIWVCTSVISRSHWTLSGGSYTKSSGGSVSAGLSGSKKLTKLTRGASQGPQFASFPRPKNPVSLGHMANGLSLLAQVMGKGRVTYR